VIFMSLPSGGLRREIHQEGWISQVRARSTILDMDKSSTWEKGGALVSAGRQRVKGKLETSGKDVPRTSKEDQVEIWPVFRLMTQNSRRCLGHPGGGQEGVDLKGQKRTALERGRAGEELLALKRNGKSLATAHTVGGNPARFGCHAGKGILPYGGIRLRAERFQ